jgi:hypothetical protein
VNELEDTVNKLNENRGDFILGFAQATVIRAIQKLVAETEKDEKARSKQTLRRIKEEARHT